MNRFIFAVLFWFVGSSCALGVDSASSMNVTGAVSGRRVIVTGTTGSGYVFMSGQSVNPTITGTNAATLFAKSGNLWMVGPTGQVSQVTPTVISATSVSVTSTPCALTAGASMQITGTCATYYTTYTGAVGFAATGIVMSEGQTITWTMQNTNAGADNAITWGASPALQWRFGTTYSTVYRSSSNVYTFMLVNGLVYVAAMDQMKAP